MSGHRQSVRYVIQRALQLDLRQFDVLECDPLNSGASVAEVIHEAAEVSDLDRLRKRRHPAHITRVDDRTCRLLVCEPIQDLPCRRTTFDDGLHGFQFWSRFSRHIMMSSLE